MGKFLYYIVWKGRKIGIFETWEECENSTKGYSNAGYKGVCNLEEALTILRDNIDTRLATEFPKEDKDETTLLEDLDDLPF